MPVTAEQEQKVKELRAGITDAPTSIVANNREDLLVLFDVIDALRGDDSELDTLTLPPNKPVI